MKKDPRNYSQYKRKKSCEKCGHEEDTLEANQYDKDGFLMRKKRKKERNYLTIHHIDHNPANNESKNLQTLCRYCHQSIHKGESPRKLTKRQQIRIYGTVHKEFSKIKY